MNNELKKARVAAPLQRELMPTDYCISLDRYLSRPGIGSCGADGEQRSPAEFGQHQAMEGFEHHLRTHPMMIRADALSRSQVEKFQAAGAECASCLRATPSRVQLLGSGKRLERDIETASA